MLGRHHLLGRAHGDDTATVFTGAGPHVDDVIGRPDGLLVVLHHDHRVSQLAEAFERAQELGVVALVQADRRLIEDVQHAQSGDEPIWVASRIR